MSDIIRCEEVKANKNHCCDYCGLQINKGTKYERSVISGDGIYVWKSHIGCQEIANLIDDAWGDGITQQDFHDFIWEKYYRLNLDEEVKFKDALSVVKSKLDVNRSL